MVNGSVFPRPYSSYNYFLFDKIPALNYTINLRLDRLNGIISSAQVLRQCAVLHDDRAVSRGLPAVIITLNRGEELARESAGMCAPR